MPYKINPPTMPGPKWSPREVFSPSGIVLSIACLRAWAYAYLFGLKQRGARGPGKLMGSVIHACQEAYLGGGNVYNFKAHLQPSDLRELNALEPDDRADIERRAPQCALTGIPFLPLPNDPAIEWRIVEGVLQLDTTALCPEFALDPVLVEGRFDFAVKSGEHYLYDHKSTSGQKAYKGRPFSPWGYAHTPETLAKDPPALIYALAFMQKYGLQHIWLRWIYYLTAKDKSPMAMPVDVRLERADVEALVREYIYRAAYLREHVRYVQLRRNAGQPLGLDYVATLELPALPPDEDSPCKAYGGCQYASANAGPCDAPTANMGALIAGAPVSATKAKKEKPMSQQLPQIPGYTWTLQADGTMIPLPDAQAQVAAGAPVTHAQSPLIPPGAAAVAIPATLPNVQLLPPETATAPAAAGAPVAPAGKPAKAPAGSRKAKPDTVAQHTAIEGLADVMHSKKLRCVEFHTDGSIASVAI